MFKQRVVSISRYLTFTPVKVVLAERNPMDGFAILVAKAG
jgi:hypothetical protein